MTTTKTHRWRFGREQTNREERSEIARALAAGRAEAYLAGQLFARMIDAETARRRARKAERTR